jgi:hypothetical protein
MAQQKKIIPMNFKTTLQANVPQGRNGKHKGVVTRILSDLDQVHAGTALKISLAELEDGKENVRSALNRATRKTGRPIATATDDNFLYIWNETREA